CARFGSDGDSFYYFDYW
nr:immunoglobulin heavy chain junction region [Macaca mulatta]MOX91872.1 immunoglobulin heavy chain junction region [Macaca mulatta]MOX92901.1 immunoglobulin heavy chain junction region [Macaca mulatta]MOX95222.1 immunoglobulin heavy chain junction region [Macaca mulatta]MOX95453.1 immunoglobulin heavy chain junction region [Macaca mulatta]